MEHLFFAPIWQHAQQTPDAPALAWRGAAISWLRLRQVIEQRVVEWRHRGLRPGHRVVLRMVSGPAHLIEALSLIAAGAVHCPVDTSLPLSQFQAAVELLEPHFLVVDNPSFSLAVAVHEDQTCTGPKLFWATYSRTAPLEKAGSAFIRHTSGTTGRSKGVLLTHQAIRERADSAISQLDLRSGDAMMWVLSLAFHFAVSVGACLRSGTCLVFASSLRPSVRMQIAQEHAVTHAYLSPSGAMSLSRVSELNLGPCLRQVIVTTAAIDATLADRLRTTLNVPVRQALGVIEIGLPLVSSGERGERAGHLGLPPPAYEVRIMDATGQECDQGERGELWIRGRGLFEAYLYPYQKASAILQNGYFATGDAAMIDARGAVCLLGRLKAMINVAGVKVFPLPVEAAISSHSAVQYVQVRGQHDEHGIECVVAHVQLVDSQANHQRMRSQLIAHCRPLLAPLEIPSQWIFQDLELTPTGKVRLS